MIIGRRYVKYEKAIEMLQNGWEIFTDNGFGGAPYTPLFFRLWKGKVCGGEIHPKTLSKLIREKVINSSDNESGSGKYAIRLIEATQPKP